MVANTDLSLSSQGTYYGVPWDDTIESTTSSNSQTISNHYICTIQKEVINFKDWLKQIGDPGTCYKRPPILHTIHRRPFYVPRLLISFSGHLPKRLRERKKHKGST